ncbi:hypothetical protein [Pseudomonas viridiflava]|uniref:hypothetical protein n=1 Tax=Pseudomonas viridiflava TaxID=33069 RepID=UPI0013CE53BD|nr:hypothetical protein [Pseudomonas viridiflava]
MIALRTIRFEPLVVGSIDPLFHFIRDRCRKAFIRAEKLICDVRRDIGFSASLESNTAS